MWHDLLIESYTTSLQYYNTVIITQLSSNYKYKNYNIVNLSSVVPILRHQF